jgi:hypothetical protein
MDSDYSDTDSDDSAHWGYISDLSEVDLNDDCPASWCSEESNVHCSICLDDCTIGDVIRTVRTCGHQFHANCLETWFDTRRSQGRCPNCRQSVAQLD